MEQRLVGRSGLRVSSVALGTAAWVAGGRSGSGPGAGSGGTRRTDEDGAAGLLRTFRTAGGTLLDVIAGSDAEAVLHRLLGPDRNEFVLAVRLPGGDTGLGGAASRQDVMSRLDASLRRLGTDHLDLLQVPVGAVGVPLEETMAAVDHAVASGRVRYAGLVDHVGWRLARAVTWQQAWPGRTPIVCDHVEYSLLARDVEMDTVPAAIELGVGLLAYAPFGGGVLVGREQGERMGIGAERVGRGNPRALGIVEAVATAADGLASTAVTVALGWLSLRPGVNSVVVGARTTAQLTAALGAHELTLPDAIRSALDDVSAPDRATTPTPGAGGPGVGGAGGPEAGRAPSGPRR